MLPCHAHTGGAATSATFAGQPTDLFTPLKTCPEQHGQCSAGKQPASVCKVPARCVLALSFIGCRSYVCQVLASCLLALPLLSTDDTWNVTPCLHLVRLVACVHWSHARREPEREESTVIFTSVKTWWMACFCSWRTRVAGTRGPRWLGLQGALGPAKWVLFSTT